MIQHDPDKRVLLLGDLGIAATAAVKSVAEPISEEQAVLLADDSVQRMVSWALSAVLGSMPVPDKQRIQDPVKDADRILAAEQKRARKAARRAARNKV